MTFFWEFGYLNSTCIRKSIILTFLVPRDINSRFCSKTQWQMFKKNCRVTWMLATVFEHLLSFFSQILDLIYWTVLILILIYFEWCDTENLQLPVGNSVCRRRTNFPLILPSLSLASSTEVQKCRLRRFNVLYE